MKQALAALPVHFRSEMTLAGILATDLHTLNSVLGASIEEQTVVSLNGMRAIWDPTGDYALYRFVRQPSTFPDVLLRGADADSVLFGIELKGWYVLAKEAVPTFRYQATPKACALPDLLVVVPWALSQVISGKPMVYTPHIMSARYAAEYRNHWWEFVREVKGNVDKRVISPPNAKPYTRGATDDKAAYDGGGNFGRIARTGLLDDFIATVNQNLLCGIRVEKWTEFFKVATEEAEAERQPSN